jgi:hypothetical protein
MNSVADQAFDKRAFISIVMAFAGLGLPITGYANHLHQFDSMTVQRHIWMAAHNSLGIIFMVFAIWHAILNRRPLLKHVKGIAIKGIRLRRELIYAVAMISILLLIFVGHAFHTGQIIR